MYYLYSENKGADQLHVYSTFVFAYEKAGFLMTRLLYNLSILLKLFLTFHSIQIFIYTNVYMFSATCIVMQKVVVIVSFYAHFIQDLMHV